MCMEHESCNDVGYRNTHAEARRGEKTVESDLRFKGGPGPEGRQYSVFGSTVARKRSPTELAMPHGHSLSTCTQETRPQLPPSLILKSCSLPSLLGVGGRLCARQRVYIYLIGGLPYSVSHRAPTVEH
jgi:hypothetical protein